MRKLFLVVIGLVPALLFSTAASALEKRAVPVTDVPQWADDWNAGGSCSVSYFNICTGWSWLWSGWDPFDTVGVCYESCCDTPSFLSVTSHFTWTAAPSGYGFTGVVKVLSDDNEDCCPDLTIATQTWLAGQSSWNTLFWGVPVSSHFIVQYQFGPGTITNPTEHVTDHPAYGPTGPDACGTCYPTTRTNHSFYFGTKDAPLCPGSALNDGVCDAQFLDSALTACPLSVEERSLAQIKNLYR